MLAQQNRSHLSWRPQVRSKELILLRMVNLLAEQAIGVIQAHTLTNPSTDAELGADPLVLFEYFGANVGMINLFKLLGTKWEKHIRSNLLQEQIHRIQFVLYGCRPVQAVQ